MFNKYGRVRGSRLPLTQSVVLNCGGALSQHKGVYARLRGRWGEGASTNAAALGHAASATRVSWTESCLQFWLAPYSSPEFVDQPSAKPAARAHQQKSNNSGDGGK